ncbi:MAG TPA: maleylpyruvate isomerase family mycothiol-dependent enzyme [Chloroflexota bacterium]|nr:maleylpyruvate isomerase family mycothiol-dependent enzyme [Chloroflexota bacterium]
MEEHHTPAAIVAAVGPAARQETAALIAQGRTWDAAGWEAASWCTGWSVRDVVAHLTESTERFGLQTRAAVAGEPVPEFSPVEREARRQQCKALPPAVLLDELERRVEAFFTYVEALPAEALARPVVPFVAGRLAPYQVAQLRLNELALHRWDIRAPREPAATLEPHVAALVVDFVLAGVPRLARAEALASLQAVFHCVATGPGGGSMTLACRAGAAEARRGAPATADAVLTLPTEALVRLVWGRLPLARALADGTVAVSGGPGAEPAAARERVLALGRVFGNPEAGVREERR